MLPLFDQDFLQRHQELKNIYYSLDYKKSPGDACKAFQAIIQHYYGQKRRPFAWRDQISSYRVVVSEIMLQQTQTDRVVPKFEQFVAQFPDFESLAKADFAEVLKYWKGLGYNRRAMALQKIAQLVVAQHNGILPSSPEILETFPGIGKATARSIVAFAFNSPTVFIETNIRTVFIYFFFQDRTDVHDKELEPLIAQTVDPVNPREWYYALMDYGVMLKKTVGNLSRKSSHYAKQSKFEGSDRQIRGKILQLLLDHRTVAQDQVALLLEKDQQRVAKILHDLVSEGFVMSNNDLLSLAA